MGDARRRKLLREQGLLPPIEKKPDPPLPPQPKPSKKTLAFLLLAEAIKGPRR